LQVDKRQWELGYRSLKPTSKGKGLKCGREKVYGMVERTSCVQGQQVGEVVHRLVKLLSQTEVLEGGGEVVNGC
jgi:hypothetical protein